MKPENLNSVPALERELTERAQKIWGVCRGLGWTLDSERACHMIYEELVAAIHGIDKLRQADHQVIQRLRDELLRIKQLLHARNQTLSWWRRKFPDVCDGSKKVEVTHGGSQNETGVAV